MSWYNLSTPSGILEITSHCYLDLQQMDDAPLDELNERLRQLAIVAQKCSPLTVKRQIAITKLIEEILNSGKLWYPYRGQYCEDVYEEAQQNLLLYICQEIEKYNSERGSVMTWVNMLLSRRFFREAVAKVREQHVIQLPTIFDLDNLTLPEQTPLLSEKIREFIEEDPEDIFKQEHIGNNIEANFQALVVRRCAGKSWQEISSELEITVSTLSSFYQRCLKKFQLSIKEYLQQ